MFNLALVLYLFLNLLCVSIELNHKELPIVELSLVNSMQKCQFHMVLPNTYLTS